MFAFLNEKPRLYESEVSYKTKSLMLSRKYHCVLYDDLVGLFKQHTDSKPVMLLPTECLVSVNYNNDKDGVELTFVGKVETCCLVLSCTSMAGNRSLYLSFQKVILTPEERMLKQAEYGEQLNGKFWENFVGIGLSNRDRMTANGSPGKTFNRIIILQGILKKRSPRAIVGQHFNQERFFILYQDALMYFKKQNDPPAGGCMLADITKVFSTGNRIELYIRQDAGERHMNLLAQSPVEAATWVEKIEKAQNIVNYAFADSLGLNENSILVNTCVSTPAATPVLTGNTGTIPPLNLATTPMHSSSSTPTANIPPEPSPYSTTSTSSLPPPLPLSVTPSVSVERQPHPHSQSYDTSITKPSPSNQYPYTPSMSSSTNTKSPPPLPAKPSQPLPPIPPPRPSFITGSSGPLTSTSSFSNSASSLKIPSSPTTPDASSSLQPTPSSYNTNPYSPSPAPKFRMPPPMSNNNGPNNPSYPPPPATTNSTSNPSTTYYDDDDDDDDEDTDEEQLKNKNKNTSVRSLVSKKKRRFENAHFNLDLTYITPQIIAMGFPSEGLEAVYRNKMTDVQRFFSTYHPGCYKVYNLCSERAYLPEKFERTARFPFDDHNPCEFRKIIDFCEDADTFLKRDPNNVIAVHCKAGKGRTGLLCSALLLFQKYNNMTTAAEVLDFYGKQRTYNGKGVTIPAQIRWVHMFEMFLNQYYYKNIPFPTYDRKLNFIGYELNPKIDFDRGGGCDPYVIMRNMKSGKKDLFNSRKDKNVKSSHGHWDGDNPFKSFFNVPISGEVLLTFMDYDAVGSDDKMFNVWLQTSFISDTTITLNKHHCEGAHKDKKCINFPGSFSVTLYFEHTESWPPNVPSISNNYQTSANIRAMGLGFYLPVIDTENYKYQAHLSSPTPEQIQYAAAAVAAANTSTIHSPPIIPKRPANMSTYNPEPKKPSYIIDLDDFSEDDWLEEESYIDDDDDEPEDDDDEEVDSSFTVAADNDKKDKSSKFTVAGLARKLVSKKKHRFITDQYDLDLTYITPQIIAMGFPSEGIESMYRNKMTDVQNFLKQYHQNNYKVYNLCSERGYPSDRFESCAHYPFDDHNPCSILTLFRFCEDASAFLQSDPKATVVIHCKAGKGRTGLMISALLMYLQAFDTAASALRYYGKKRTSNYKGVTIPSQQRFVVYFEQFMKYYYYSGLANSFPFNGTPIIFTVLILKNRCNFDRGGGCDPYVVITSMDGTVLYNGKKQLKKIPKWEENVDEYMIDLMVRVQGEVKFQFYDHDSLSFTDQKMFHFWLHTSFLAGSTTGMVELTKEDLDKAVKDKKCINFPEDFMCNVFFKASVDDFDDL